MIMHRKDQIHKVSLNDIFREKILHLSRQHSFKVKAEIIKQLINAKTGELIEFEEAKNENCCRRENYRGEKIGYFQRIFNDMTIGYSNTKIKRL